LSGFRVSRLEPPCPRQSSTATAKPRRRSSPTTSKYFSMNSARPGKMQTVPRRSRNTDCQLAKRNRRPLRTSI